MLKPKEIYRDNRSRRSVYRTNMRGNRARTIAKYNALVLKRVQALSTQIMLDRMQARREPLKTLVIFSDGKAIKPHSVRLNLMQEHHSVDEVDGSLSLLSFDESPINYHLLMDKEFTLNYKDAYGTFNRFQCIATSCSAKTYIADFALMLNIDFKTFMRH